MIVKLVRVYVEVSDAGYVCVYIQYHMMCGFKNLSLKTRRFVRFRSRFGGVVNLKRRNRTWLARNTSF